MLLGSSLETVALASSRWEGLLPSTVFGLPRWAVTRWMLGVERCHLSLHLRCHLPSLLASLHVLHGPMPFPSLTWLETLVEAVRVQTSKPGSGGNIVLSGFCFPFCSLFFYMLRIPYQSELK